MFCHLSVTITAVYGAATPSSVTLLRIPICSRIAAHESNNQINYTAATHTSRNDPQKMLIFYNTHSLRESTFCPPPRKTPQHTTQAHRKQRFLCPFFHNMTALQRGVQFEDLPISPRLVHEVASRAQVMVDQNVLSRHLITNTPAGAVHATQNWGN